MTGSRHHFKLGGCAPYSEHPSHREAAEPTLLAQLVRDAQSMARSNVTSKAERHLHAARRPDKLLGFGKTGAAREGGAPIFSLSCLTSASGRGGNGNVWSDTSWLTCLATGVTWRSCAAEAAKAGSRKSGGARRDGAEPTLRCRSKCAGEHAGCTLVSVAGLWCVAGKGVTSCPQAGEASSADSAGAETPGSGCVVLVGCGGVDTDDCCWLRLRVGSGDFRLSPRGAAGAEASISMATRTPPPPWGPGSSGSSLISRGRSRDAAGGTDVRRTDERRRLSHE